MTITEKFKLPKTLNWTQIGTASGKLEFDCPKCLQKNTINTSVFNTKTHQDNEELNLSDQKFGYTDKALVILGNIIAFGITILILFGLLGEYMNHKEYGKLTYIIGIPIMWVLARVIVPLFRKTLPVWLLKCKECGETIILSSNGVETHLARDTAAKKSKQDTATSEKEQTTVKSPNEAAIWDLKNGEKKAKNNAAETLLNAKDPNAVEIILEQALKEDPEPENKSFLATSVKADLLMTLSMNIKKVRTSKTLNAYINVLSAKDDIVLDHAIYQLGNLASPQAIKPLEKLLSEGTYKNAKWIEKAIKRIKKKNRIPI